MIQVQLVFIDVSNNEGCWHDAKMATLVNVDRRTFSIAARGVYVTYTTSYKGAFQ